MRIENLQASQRLSLLNVIKWHDRDADDEDSEHDCCQLRDIAEQIFQSFAITHKVPVITFGQLHQVRE